MYTTLAPSVQRAIHLPGPREDTGTDMLTKKPCTAELLGAIHGSRVALEGKIESVASEVNLLRVDLWKVSDRVKLLPVRRSRTCGHRSPQTAWGRGQLAYQDADFKELLAIVKTILKAMSEKLDILTHLLDQVKQRMFKHENRLDHLENCVSDTDNTQADSKEHLLRMDKILELIKAKNEDLEDKLPEFSEEAVQKTNYFNCDAQARHYGQGDRPGKTLEGMLCKPRASTYTV
ncbi:hypothetical protein NDU88_007161 [Pleurodeles waltl]|uniref:Uncharacterized protein n=1 Tax=Pleurodeles waltl TaxID=8319 RepID=A0AAV7N672_PLEWA|nr:hypothetical protein NDU88_007161 [Pleurodeles waltl]